MRKELFWDRNNHVPMELEIERAINFGGFDYIKKVQRKYGMKNFINVLMNGKNLSKKAVSYWCVVLRIDRKKTYSFSNQSTVWLPQR